MRPIRRLTWFVRSIVAAAAAITLATLLRPTHEGGGEQWFVAALFAGMTALAQIYRIQVAPGNHVAVDTASAFAAALILPPHLAGAAVLTGLIIAAVVRRGIVIQ
jgi:hypothetical protein